MAKLNFRTLDIRKAPGFARGISNDSLNNLSHDINIVAGPNGAGKSTIARIIQQLIWQDNAVQLNAAGTYELDDEKWTIDVDGTFVRTQRDGNNAEPAGLPAAEYKQVYMLALHELVNIKDQELAKKIMAESIGGYDLEAAQKDLGYTNDIKNRRIGEFTEYKNSDISLHDLTKVHNSLKVKADNLESLEIEIIQAKAAGALIDLYRFTENFLIADKEASEAGLVLNRFPAELNNLDGKELEKVDDFENEIETENGIIERATGDISEREEIIKNMALPEEGIDKYALEEMKERIDRLEKTENDISNLLPEIKRLESEESAEKKSIENLTDPEQFKGIDLDKFGDLDKFYNEALGAIENIIRLRSEVERLRKEESAVNTDPGKLSNGIRSLIEWLKILEPVKGITSVKFSIFFIISLATLFAASFLGKAGLIGGAFALAIVFSFLIFNKKKVGDPGVSEVRKKDFIGTGLQQPSEWTTDAVLKRIEELYNDLGKAMQEEAESLKRKELLKIGIQSLSLAEEKMSNIESKRLELLQKLKAGPDLPQRLGDTYSSLYLFIEHLKNWQKKHTELEGKRSLNQGLESQRVLQIKWFEPSIAAVEAGLAIDSTGLKKVYNQLLNAVSKKNEALSEIKGLNNQISESKKRIEKLQTRIDEAFSVAGIAENDKGLLSKLTGQLNDFKAASNTFRDRSLALDAKRRDLESHPLFNENSAEIKGMGIFQVQQKLKELGLITERYDALIKQQADLNAQIDLKRNGVELEEMLLEKQIKLSALDKLYEKNLSSVTGALLMDHLKKETTEQSRSEVFSRANQIFNGITSGRYELRITSDDGHGFRAFDTVSRMGLDLTEISTGTRVQLLISIRLAFIESIENNVSIPIMADELLANSDDQRAKAIIDALYEISRNGRQIFYFTAQPDEVGKWKSYMENKKGLDYRIILLGGIEEDKQNYLNYVPPVEKMEFVYNVPEPGKRTMKEYREILKIQSYDLISDKPSRISISWLITDTKLLYNCLFTGIRRWGQLENYLSSGGKIERVDESVFSKMKNLIILLEELQELYRQGRPKPVDMETLLESKAISETFSEQVREKLIAVNGNPAKLLEALNEISGFRNASKDKIEDFLFERGYLDDNKPVENDDIRVRLQARISALGIDREEAGEFINSILDSINFESPGRFIQ